MTRRPPTPTSRPTAAAMARPAAGRVRTSADERDDELPEDLDVAVETVREDKSGGADDALGLYLRQMGSIPLLKRIRKSLSPSGSNRPARGSAIRRCSARISLPALSTCSIA